MINFSEAEISKLVVHNVGNKSNDGGIKLSKQEYQFENNALKEVLLKYLTTPFKSGEFYNLFHESELKLNEVYSYVSEIFDNKAELFTQSVSLAKFLYEQSTHPKVKVGEFYTVYFTDCTIDGELVDAVGLFKSETKETFLKVHPTKDNIEIKYEDGVNINKLDKGCMIFNLEREQGFLVSIVDTVSKGYDAQYWKDHFLHLRERNDNYHQTQNLLSMCKHFVTEQMPEELDNATMADQAELLNKSLSFFKENDTFNLKDFEEEVIRKPEAIKAFRNFKEQFEDEREISISDEFDISSPAVKKQQRIFKSVIKLDKNFHIYIHGDRELIERGYDKDTGMSYYKVFFKEES